MKLSTKILAVVLGSAIAIAFVVGVTTTASAAGFIFTRTLSVGTTGADVMELQKVLNSNPATVIAATGVGSIGMESSYFGGLTKAAVMKFQAANGISTTGTVGPLTRAALNRAAPVASTGALCPNGMTLASNCSAAPGTTVTVALCPNGMTIASNCSAAPSGTVSTNGVEGTLSVDQSNAGLPSSVYEGDTKVGVLSFKVQAKNSNITVQRVKIDLGTLSTIYTKKFSRIYVLDGSTVIASSDLNSSTVVKESNNQYTITLTGMNVVVAKDATKVLTIAADVYSSVDLTYRSVASTFRLYGTDGTAIRGIDGAGLNEYAGDNTITRTIASISTTLVDSANIKLSLDANTPSTNQVIASSGTTKDQYDRLPVLAFDLRADKDNILVTDLVATIGGTAQSNGNITTAYLMDGSQEVSNSSIVAGVATFSNINLNVVNNSTKVLTVTVDVRNATGTKTVTAAVANTQITAENSVGDSLVAASTITGGPATSNTMTVVKSGAAIDLISAVMGTPNTISYNGNATSSVTATFTYRVTASGADAILGDSASTTYQFASSSSYVVYRNQVPLDQAANPTIASVAITVPSSGVAIDNTNHSFTISDGNSAIVTVQVGLVGSTSFGSVGQYSYSIQTNALDVSHAVINFMSGQSAWRTSAVPLP